MFKEKLLFRTMVGSQVYGTNNENSDEDFKGVMLSSFENLVGFNYKSQIEVNKDELIYDLKRFLELLKNGNPTCVEMLFTPKEYFTDYDETFNILFENRDKFITKKLIKSFIFYGSSQIKKAKGLDKKQNWDRSKFERKDVLDFIFVQEYGKSIPWKIWSEENDIDSKFCGVANVPHGRDIYFVYYDQMSHLCFSELMDKSDREHNVEELKDKKVFLGYKGIVKVGNDKNLAVSNQLRLSSIPKEYQNNPIATIYYNKDGYSTHCREYVEYQNWLKNRNTSRYVDNVNHNQKIDSKNVMHCVRLVNMGYEIAKGLGVNVRRVDSDYLKEIRLGQHNLIDLIDETKNKMEEIKTLDISFLPDEVDENLINEIYFKIISKNLSK